VIRVAFLLALMALLGVTACGRKGELEPPPPRQGFAGVPAHDAVAK
jgi:predicted small lipoprotein YifL